jgi:XRE family transcriptional regulator, regulator of sulfur utilization
MSASPISPHAQRLATALRHHRSERNLSLGDLSRSTGLSKTSLARLEAGEGNPSLETLWRIGHELGLTIAQLVEEPDPNPATILGADEGAIVVSGSGMTGRLLQHDHSRHRTEVFELTLQADARFQGDAHDVGTRELVHCVAGTIICGPDDQPLELGVGDSASFDGGTAHHYSGGTEGGRAILIMSYPLERG